MGTTRTTIRLDDDLRGELDKRLAVAGISFNEYMTMAAERLVIQNRIPFAILAPDRETPNDRTRRAMVLAEARDLGLISDKGPAFADVDEMMAYLDDGGAWEKADLE